MEFKDANINIPYGIYETLSENDRFQIDFIIEYGNIESKDYFSSIPLEEREFEFVKEMMQYFDDGKFDEIVKMLFGLPEYDVKTISMAPAWKVIVTLKFITGKIAKLSTIENKMLTPLNPDGKYDDYLAQVDFSMFNTEYIQVRDLAGGDILKFDEIRKLPYNKCLVELIYKQKQSDLDNLIMKSTNTGIRK